MCIRCDLSRRRFLRGAAATLAATAALPGMLRAAGDAPVILGSGRHRYRVEAAWARVPPGYVLRDAAAVCVDSADQVYVFNRSEHPVMVFDRDGNFLRSWGEDVGFVNAHGASIGPDDCIYLTDDHGHAVRKFTRAGELMLVIGTPRRGAPRFSGNPFNRCTHTALSPGGDIYVSDGYQNARVHKYDPDGRWLLSWGEPGTDPGQFNLVHNIACDAEGNVYVADRENHRVQVFDPSGNYLAQWNNLARPCGLALTGGAHPMGVVGELGPETAAGLTAGVPNLGPRVSLVSLSGEVLTHLGTRPIGEGVGQFIAPHGIAVDSRGDIYVAEVSATYWPIIFGKKPDHDLRCFQKLVRLD